MGASGKFGFRLLAVKAASTLASKPVAAPAAGAPAATQGGDGFAQLVAKLNPKAQDAQKTDNPNSDIAAALASMQNVVPLPAQTKVAPGDGGETAQRTIDPAQLRAALEQNAQSPQTKPATPALPVMPVQGGADDDADSTDEAGLAPNGAAAKPTEAADVTLASAAQHLLRPATPAQTTQAQAVPARFDAKADSQDGGANADANGQGSQNGSQNGQPGHAAPQAAAQPAAHATAAPAAPAQQAGTNTATLAAANASNNAAVSAASAPASTSAMLHVAPAAQTASQPDIAALAVTIAAKSADGTKHFDIRLDPPEFGRIDVRMSVDDAGKAQAHLTADKPQTLALLQRDCGTLQRALKDSGVDVGNSGLQFSLRGQERQGGGEDPSTPRGRALSVTAAVAAPTASTWSLAPDSARLDIRV